MKAEGEDEELLSQERGLIAPSPSVDAMLKMQEVTPYQSEGVVGYGYGKIPT